MTLIDTHAHLNDPKLSWPLKDVIDRAAAASVVQCVIPGWDVESSKLAMSFGMKYPKVCFPAIGIHPQNVVQLGQAATDQLLAEIEILADSSGIVAIGEVGIDYYHHDRSATKSVQQTAFVRQIELAKKHQIPIIIHGREAYDDVLAVMADFRGVPAVLHSFEASYEVARKALNLGLLISLTALITYKNREWLREVVARLPLDRLMVETDAPYLPPQRLRDQAPPPKLKTGEIGKHGVNNEPANVVDVAERLAAIKSTSLEEVAIATTKTARRFFKLPEAK